MIDPTNNPYNDFGPLLRSVYRFPREKLARTNLPQFVVVACIYIWTCLISGALIGLMVEFYGSANLFFTDLWVNSLATALIGTLICCVVFLSSKHIRTLYLPYLGALVLITCGITVLFFARCSDCVATIQQVEQGFLRDFTKEELIKYIFALRLTYEQRLAGTFLILSGLSLLVLAAIVAHYNQRDTLDNNAAAQHGAVADRLRRTRS